MIRFFSPNTMDAMYISLKKIEKTYSFSRDCMIQFFLPIPAIFSILRSRKGKKCWGRSCETASF